MKFLIDAQLPRFLGLLFKETGHDAIHTLDLQDGNKTTDTRINELSVQQQRVVITKDADFVSSFLLFGKPYKLLLVSTGNITNNTLKELFIKNRPAIIHALAECDYVELSRHSLIKHR